MVEILQEKKNSTHKVEVALIKLERHPNADRLSIVRVFGYQVCTGTEGWTSLPPHSHDEQGNPQWLAAYIPPDTLVPVNRPEFDFLADKAKSDGKARIKAMKLRGYLSFGLLVPAPAGSQVGDDVSDLLGTEHYEPPMPGESGKAGLFLGGESCSGPSVFAPKYDLEAFRRYAHEMFNPGEMVIASCKVDGCSARYVYHAGKMYCGSRTEWKKEFPDYSHVTFEGLIEKGVDEERARAIVERLHSQPKKKNLWWDILEKTPALEKFCRDNEGVVVYGEVAGLTNCLKYFDHNEFFAFDLLKDGKWLDFPQAYDLATKANLPWVPLLSDQTGTPYDFDRVCELAEGPSRVPGARPGTIREGVVIKPLQERVHERHGRVCLKAVSAAFLEKFR